MLYTQLNYIAHKLLTSKYRFFINLFFILSLYFIFLGNKIVHCMNEEINEISKPIRQAQLPSPSLTNDSHLYSSVLSDTGTDYEYPRDSDLAPLSPTTSTFSGMSMETSASRVQEAEIERLKTQIFSLEKKLRVVQLEREIAQRDVTRFKKMFIDTYNEEAQKRMNAACCSCSSCQEARQVLSDHITSSQIWNQFDQLNNQQRK